MTIEVSTLRLDPGAGAPDAEEGAFLRAYADLIRRELVSTFGDDDLADSAEVLQTVFREQRYRRKAALLARDGDTVVGGAWLAMPLRDNTSVASCAPSVDPACDPAPVLAALWEHVLPQVREAGRSTVQVWTGHVVDPSAPQVVPRTGVGSLPRDAKTRALEELGLALEQVERHSVLQVRLGLQAAARELPAAREAAGTAYRTLGWVGPTPQDRLEALARLMARMSTDAPSGGLELEEEAWDAERVAELDRVCVATGRTRVMTVAEHVGTGDLVAYTVVELPEDKPAAGYQEDTLVHSDHRGHRLGMLVKAQNLRRVADHAPDVQRLHTWNAGENEHMLAINVALGFRSVTVEGGWQLTGV